MGNDDKLHMIFQTDAQVGMHVAGDMHSIAYNDIVYYPIDIQYFRNLSSIKSRYNFSDGIAVYPNPSSGIVNLEFDRKMNTSIEAIAVYNLIGSAMEVGRKNTSNQNVLELDLGHLEKGIYLLKIPDGNKFITKKIIKN